MKDPTKSESRAYTRLESLRMKGKDDLTADEKYELTVLEGELFLKERGYVSDFQSTYWPSQSGSLGRQSVWYARAQSINMHLANYEVQVANQNFEFELDCWLSLDAPFESTNLDEVEDEHIDRLLTIIRQANDERNYNINADIILDPEDPRRETFIDNNNPDNYCAAPSRELRKPYIDELTRRISRAFTRARPNAEKKASNQQNSTHDGQVKRRKS